MRNYPRLGSVNAALISIYFALTWGGDGLRALTSPYNGFEDRLHATAAIYFRNLFDFGLEGLIRTANLLAGVKFVIAVAFVAYLIDFARALVMRREPNRETLDVVLLFASAALMLWAWPALGSGDGGLVRLHATQFLLLTGAMVVILVERHLEERVPATAPSRSTTRTHELERERQTLASGGLLPIGSAVRGRPAVPPRPLT
jgi:hypothetical protein